MQDRELNHQGVSASLSYTTGVHRVKGGLQYDRSPLVEQFQMVGVDTRSASAQRFDPLLGGEPFSFSGSRVGHNLGLFLQDAWTPMPDFHVTLGLRVDGYSLVVEESAVSPALVSPITCTIPAP